MLIINLTNQILPMLYCCRVLTCGRLLRKCQLSRELAGLRSERNTLAVRVDRYRRLHEAGTDPAALEKVRQTLQSWGRWGRTLHPWGG